MTSQVTPQSNRIFTGHVAANTRVQLDSPRRNYYDDAVVSVRRPANKLLALLAPHAFARIAHKLTPTALHARQILYRPNQSIDTVFFPETAVIVQMTIMANGDTLETATVGHEGASWISASIGAPSIPCETVVAIAGEALALDIADLDREMKENALFRDVLTQYSHALLVHSMRMTGCTGLHSLEQRCGRWVLETLDRVSADRVSITHEFLSMLLGASRPSVSVAIQHLVKRGALQVERGRLSLGDRDELLKMSCDCYAVIKTHYEQVGRSVGRNDEAVRSTADEG